MMDNKVVNIYLEANPNPNSLKFVANFMLVEPGENFDFPNPESASHAPLAQKIFENFDFVTRVFYMSNFITITKKPEVEWLEIQDQLKHFIKEYLEAEGKILIEHPEETLKEEDHPAEMNSGSELEGKIRSVLDEYVKPAVEMDGGAIAFQSFNEGIVKVNLKGACSGCPSSMVTLKAGIENLLKSMVPEVKSVEASEV